MGKILSLVILALLITDTVHAKKIKKSKRPQKDTSIDETTPQPNVVTYSSFGFNDVGPNYDGFVPSSPDYASYLSNYKQETSTKLYGPAFPSSDDNTEYNFGSQNHESQSYGSNGGGDHSMLQYQHNPYGFNNQQFDLMNSESQNQNAHDDIIYDKNADDFNSPVYGSKLGSKSVRSKPFSRFNITQDLYGMSPSGPGEENYEHSHQEHQSTHQEHSSNPSQEDKPYYGASGNNYFNSYNYGSSQQTANTEAPPKPTTNNGGSIKYSQVLDFTKYKPNYPTEVENKFISASFKPFNSYGSQQPENNHENAFSFSYNSNNDFHLQNKEKEPFSEDDDEKENHKPMSYNYHGFTINHVEPTNKESFNYSKLYTKVDYKDKYKYKNKPTNFNYGQHNTSEHLNWKSPIKSYEFPKDYSTTGFNKPFETSLRKPQNTVQDGEYSASNVVDLTNYTFSGNDHHSVFKKFPDYKHFGNSFSNDEYFPKFQDNFSVDDKDYTNQLKSIYGNPSTSSQWGQGFKSVDNSTPKKPKKPYFNEEGSDSVVHIPKRPPGHKYHMSKPNSNKQNEWSSHQRPSSYKNAKPLEEWNKDVGGRFKSEEDLLGLRNKDPSFPPTFKTNSDAASEFQKYSNTNSYKNLMDKWRQSYLKSKYKNYKEFKENYDDQDVYGSEQRPMHVPVPKPYPIEVPHPIIVPVPQPYPVKVPVPKPVAVPVVKEITVQIEKPVPYPVIKKVPYPIEKLVPTPVEKEVQVPVIKPYPVPVPHVRPVFHHTKSHDDFDMEGHGDLDDDDYFHHRPERERERERERPDSYGNKKIRYVQKTRGVRSRSRRPPPSHATYHDRRRRWPARRSPPLRRDVDRRRRRPNPVSYSPSIRYHEYETEALDSDEDSYEKKK